MTAPVVISGGIAAAPGYRPTPSGHPWRINIARLDKQHGHARALSSISPTDTYDTEAAARTAAAQGVEVWWLIFDALARVMVTR